MTTNYLPRIVGVVSGTSGGPPPTSVTTSAAQSAYQLPGAGGSGLLYDIVIVDGTAWETYLNVPYINGSTSWTLSSGTFESSSTGSALNSIANGALLSASPSATMFRSVAAAIGYGTDLSITTTATATIGQMHVCTGTSANYAVTLPAASACAGQTIGFRMGSATDLTKLVTLTAAGGDKIDGSATRVMWATETAILKSDGTNWFKIAGKTVQMSCSMYLTAAGTTLTSGSIVKCPLNGIITDCAGLNLMSDTSVNNRINIVRPGLYAVLGAVLITPYSNATPYTVAGYSFYNGAQLVAQSAEIPASDSGYGGASFSGVCQAAASSYLELYGYQNSASNAVTFYGSASHQSQLSALEQLSW